MAMRILAIVGSYRKDGIIDRLVTEALSGAQKEHSAPSEKALRQARSAGRLLAGGG